MSGRDGRWREADALREKLADILRRTANALHGGPLPNGFWSWHDLPELVERLRAGDDPAKDPRPTYATMGEVRDAAQRMKAKHARSLGKLKD